MPKPKPAPRVKRTKKSAIKCLDDAIARSNEAMKKRPKKPRRVAVWGLMRAGGVWVSNRDGQPWGSTSKRFANETAGCLTGFTVRRIGWLEVKS